MREKILEMFNGVPVEVYEKLLAKHQKTKKTRGKLQAKVQRQTAAYAELMEAFKELKKKKSEEI